MIITREQADPAQRAFVLDQIQFSTIASHIRAAAKFDPEAKFMGLRHGGNTEGSDAGLSDADGAEWTSGAQTCR